MKNGKAKRIIALSGVAILVGLYLFTFIAAILAKPYKNELFIACLFCTIIIPVLIYCIMLVGRAFGRKEGELSLREIRRMNKELKNVPDSNEQEGKQS